MANTLGLVANLNWLLIEISSKDDSKRKLIPIEGLCRKLDIKYSRVQVKMDRANCAENQLGNITEIIGFPMVRKFNQGIVLSGILDDVYPLEFFQEVLQTEQISSYCIVNSDGISNKMGLAFNMKNFPDFSSSETASEMPIQKLDPLKSTVYHLETKRKDDASIFLEDLKNRHFTNLKLLLSNLYDLAMLNHKYESDHIIPADLNTCILSECSYKFNNKA